MMWREAYKSIQPDKESNADVIESVRSESEEAEDNLTYPAKVKTSGKKPQKADLSSSINIGKTNLGTGQTQLNKIVDAITAEIKNRNIPQALKLFNESKTILKFSGISFEKIRSEASSSAKTKQSRPIRFSKEDRFAAGSEEPTTTVKQEDKKEEPKQKVYSPAVEKLRQKFDEAYADITKKSYFDNLRNGLFGQLNLIDEELNSLNKIDVVDGNRLTTFRVVDKADENPGLWGYSDLNAYDRDVTGFVSDKPSTKEALLYKRRMLLDELEKIRDN